MKSFSVVKGDPGAPTGLTRWQRQYSGQKQGKEFSSTRTEQASTCIQAAESKQ
jgi:hypothetical protein